MRRLTTQQLITEKKYRRIPTTRYKPDFRHGLTSQQVQEHRLHGWLNEHVEAPAKTTKSIIYENVFTYYNLIFLTLAVLLCLVGSFRSLTFMPVIISNTLIGIIQGVRAKSVLEKLNMLNAPKATVIRDSKKSVVAADKLVIDDIVVFRAGAQVCADAEICAGEVQVNEALLSGESEEVSKKKGDSLMSGSFIVSGECFARLDKVGVDSYISKLTLKAKELQGKKQSEMIRSLNMLVKAVGIAIIPIGIILFIQAFFYQNEGFKSSVTSMVAAIIGMIPEGLYLLSSAALAVSAIRLAKNKVLLHDMRSIETLARVDVLCVDKTGTITENNMQVQEIIPTDNYDPQKTAPLSMLMSDFVMAMDTDNITMAALKRTFKTPAGRKCAGRTLFSSETKYSSAEFEDGTYVLGAPEFVLREDYHIYEEKITEYTSKGMRVLVFGTYDGKPGGKPLEKPICPLGYIILANPVRQGAGETFAYFKAQGVEVKVISGDNPVTVSEAAKAAGIAGAEDYVDASSINTDAELKKAVLAHSVFGRVSPEQKRKFIRALKEAGKTVAMTGDGVNDILALKDADCSIAMASGSEAAAQASQLVLLESDFSRMPKIVMEGRRVVNNIQRSASLFLVKNIFSFLLSLLSLVFMFTYPLEPSQISLISMFTIGIPASFLALEPNRNLIKGRFLANVFLKALPAALTDALAVGALVVFGQTFGVDSQDISVAATMLLSIVGFMILYKISAPLNRLRASVIAGNIAGLLFCIIFLNQLFAITAMSTKCVMLFVVFSIATEPVLRYLTLFIGKLSVIWRKIRSGSLQ